MKREASLISATGATLFERVASILEEARANVVRAVNSNMVLAYWLIGREIVQELQDGEERAEYGKRTIEALSKQLTARFGSGFSEQSLQNFRRFYQVYPDRVQSLGFPPRQGGNRPCRGNATLRAANRRKASRRNSPGPTTGR